MCRSNNKKFYIQFLGTQIICQILDSALNDISIYNLFKIRHMAENTMNQSSNPQTLIQGIIKLNINKNTQENPSQTTQSKLEYSQLQSPKNSHHPKVNKNNSEYISSGFKSPRSKLTQRSNIGRQLPFPKEQTPGPGHYRTQSMFDPQSSKGFVISSGPERNPIDSYINKQALKNPPLTRYNVEDRNAHKSPSFTMGSKFRDFMRVKTEQELMNNPGPSDYKRPQLFSPKHNVHGYRSPPSVIYSPKSQKRFFEMKDNNPGPGQYRVKNNLSANGAYVSSNLQGTGCRYFDNQQRKYTYGKSHKQLRTPGPGFYEVGSQFDKYKKQKDTINMKKKKV